MTVASLVEPDLRERLLNAARDAAKRAYCPYSQFRVGAAVLIDGELFCGCNIENASYGLTICAERAAIFHAFSRKEGGRIQALAVTCPDAPPDSSRSTRMPCGACRQVIAEFADPDLPVIIDSVGDFRLADLLPRPFQL